MLYEEARVYLEHVSKYGRVLGLESIRHLMEELGNPQDELQVIHIAGTNGKGSILAYVSTVLQCAGWKVGRYISPTIMEYLERFQIDGAYMPKEMLAPIVEEVKQAAERMQAKGVPYPTAFEIETAIAFVYFAREKCNFVVLETGLGGRLDATNIVKNTKVCVFASISMDHMAVLGDTLAKIAGEKAGILKPESVAVSYPQTEEVRKVLQHRAEEKKIPLWFANKEQIVVQKEELESQIFSYKEFRDIEIHLTGRNQIENAITALEVICALRNQNVSIPDEAIYQGMRRTEWPGRFQILEENPLVIVDGAHNEDAARRLEENIQTYLQSKPVIGVMGVFKDKVYKKIIEIMKPYLDYVYTIDLPNKERTLDRRELVKALNAQGIGAEDCESVEKALEKAKKSAKDGHAVLVFGSLSYLGEVIRLENGKQQKKNAIKDR